MRQLRETLQEIFSFCTKTDAYLMLFFWAGLNSVFFKVISVVHLFFSALLDATQQYFWMRETRHKNTHSCDIV